MTSLESMIRKLSPLDVYDLSEKSIVYAELAAFGTGLDILKDSLSELLKEGFIATAESFGIDYAESLVGNLRDDLPLEKRREMLIQRLSFSVNDFTLEGFKRMLSFMGIEGEIVESPQTERIVVDLSEGEYTSAEREWIVAQVTELFPAHLLCDVIFAGFCWADSDEAGNTFAQIDGKGYTWKEIDLL